MLTPDQQEFLKQHLTLDGDGNVVGSDNTVQVTKQTAGDYAVQIGEQRIMVNVAELRSVLNVENSQVGVIGDHAHVDQIIFQTTPPTNPRERRNRAAMLQLVRNTWIKGVLEQSLHGAAMLELGKDYDPQSVVRPWDIEYHLPGQERRPVPQGTSILEIFDQCSGALLILGEPGSGKTTTLLELARALIDRAEDDPTAHIPVVFNLSSWDTKQVTLEEWLLAELRTKYQVPKEMAQAWLDNDTVLPLLDGLDEVQAGARASCVTAINAFRQEHFVPLAVCSRTADYEAHTTKLRLEGAICLRPLTPAQIDAYLVGAGTELQAVRATLQHDPVLQEMAESPLMLSIMTLAYRGLKMEELQTFATPEARREHLFDTYVKQVFQRRIKKQRYTQEQTLHSLTWLAGRMTVYEQTVFYIEGLQPHWLPNRESQRTRCLARLVSDIIGGVVFGLPFGLVFGLAFGVAIGLIVALILELAFRMSNSFNMVAPIKISKWSWQKANSGLCLGLIGGSVGGLVIGLLGGRTFGLLIGLLLVFVGVLGKGLGKEEINAKTAPNQGIRKSIKNVLFVGLLFGSCVGVVFALIGKSLLGTVTGVALGLSIGLVFVLVSGLLLGQGMTIILHFVIRLVLAFTNRLPFRLVRFLDYCVDRIFLRRVGGGYMFIHPLFQEYFASLTPEDIERLAANADA